MEVKVKKSFEQKLSYDPKLDGLERIVISPIKEKKFDDMIDRIGENGLTSLLAGKSDSSSM